MSRIAASGPNAAQIEYWNDVNAQKWVDLEDPLDSQISGLGDAGIEGLAIEAGMSVVDVGCGCGQTSLQLAERVGQRGSVLGIDISARMLERARTRAAESGLSHLRFENADAQIHAFAAGAADRWFSRFGVMFFADPVAAFANLRTALAPGGRAGFLCWQPFDRNPWIQLPMRAAEGLVPAPPPMDPEAPGPMALADPDRTRRLLSEAGYTDIAIEPVERELLLGGGGFEEGVDFSLRMGPLATLLRDADAELVAKVRDAVREASKPYETEDGLRMDAAAWFVTSAA